MKQNAVTLALETLGDRRQFPFVAESYRYRTRINEQYLQGYMNSDTFASELTMVLRGQRCVISSDTFELGVGKKLSRQDRFQARPIVNVQAQTGLAEHLELPMSVA